MDPGYLQSSQNNQDVRTETPQMVGHIDSHPLRRRMEMQQYTIFSSSCGTAAHTSDSPADRLSNSGLFKFGLVSPHNITAKSPVRRTKSPGGVSWLG